ncbi:MAG: L-rhamnose mutarotase, partial [Chitinophagia bacterium]|nr:L-rhamnose mutarotase [Chitinophagia bacterium]
IQSIRASGILDCSIYRIENRLTMILKTTDEFDFSLKAIDDQNNPKVQEWETLMWKYQQALPTARPGEKWILMKSIFQLSQI